MELVHEFTWTTSRAFGIAFGTGPCGTRSFGAAGEGVVRGARLNGRIVASGGDWVHFGTDGYARPDVRVHVATDDGAFVLMTYGGLIEWNEAVRRASASGSATTYDDHYWRCTPRLETGDARYAWVNQSLFVSRGRFLGDAGVEYEVFRVT